MRGWLAILAGLGLVLGGPAYAQPKADEPTTDTPTTDKPTTDKPTTDKPTTDKPAPGQTAPANPGGFSKLPSLKRDVQPVYPPQALVDRVEADVVLEVDIATDGTVDSANAVEVTLRKEDGSPAAEDSYNFGRAATIAGTQLEFEPAEKAGVKTAVRIKYTYRFRLPTPAPEPEPMAKKAPATRRRPTPKPIVNMRGVIVERGTRTLMAGVKVTVYRGKGAKTEGFEATSDDNGKFQFYDLAPGKWRVVAEREGYIPFKTSETVGKKELVEVKYYVERGSYNPYDVTIEADRPMKEVNRRTLKGTEIAKIAGTLGDPVLVVENLPGVARTLDGTIIVRGSGPEDTGIYIDGSTVPLIYHFGGLKSVVPAQVVDSVDFVPGNYSVQFGRAMGGIFDLHIKKLDPTQVHGTVDISILDTSLYLEAPLGDNAAIAVAGRRSYIDVVLQAAIPEDSDVGIISAPRYYDYQVLGNWQPGPAHDLRWLFLGSDDLFELLFDDPADQVGPGAQDGNVALKTNFQRLTADYRFTPGLNYRNRLKVALGRDVIDFNALGVIRLEVNVHTIELRDVSTFTLTKNLNLDVGVDMQFSDFNGIARFPRIAREGEAPDEFDPEQVLFSAFDGSAFNVAPFVEASARLGKLTVVPGLRLDYFGASESASFDPRIVMRYDFNTTWAVKGGVGVVHQEPNVAELDPVFGNPKLGLQTAYHYSLGGEWKPLDFLKLDVTLFYKDIDNLLSSSDRIVMSDGMSIPETFNNRGEGQVFGAELFLEHKFANNLRGWISYTLSRAERTDDGATESRLFSFDQTHIFAIVANYVFGRNWEAGLRWRVVTGNPYTPITGGVFVNEIDEYAPVSGAINSRRLPSFQQLDLRIDKTWVYRTWKLSAYLSVINAYNRRNVEGIVYNFDFSEQGTIGGLPFVPILGLKADW